MKPILLVTGVSGRIGQAVANSFANDYQVIGLDIYAPKNQTNVDFFLTDLSKFESVKESLNKVKEKYGDKIASCIHLAAYYNFTGGGWDKYQAITINGTAFLLEALKDFTLEQFVFSSTLLVYEPVKPGSKINESSPVNAKWEYPKSKVETEKIVLENTNGNNVILRIAGIYDDGCHSIPISQHIARIYEKKFESHFFPGNVHHGATFLLMDDLICALKATLSKRSELKNEIFVLGEPEVMSFLDLQHAIGLGLHQKKWWTIRIPKLIAKVGSFLQNSLPFMKKSFIKPWMVDLADDHYDVDISKAEKLLKWQPMHRLKICLTKMLEDLARDPKAWYKKNGL